MLGEELIWAPSTRLLVELKAEMAGGTHSLDVGDAQRTRQDRGVWASGGRAKRTCSSVLPQTTGFLCLFSLNHCMKLCSFHKERLAPPGLGPKLLEGPPVWLG